MSTLQYLADIARCSSHSRAAEYEAVLRQVRPIMYRKEYGDVITRLLDNKEETAVASTIAKMVKQSVPQPRFHPYRRPLMGARGNCRPRQGRQICLPAVVPGILRKIVLHDASQNRD